jgi:hypothetical protein
MPRALLVARAWKLCQNPVDSGRQRVCARVPQVKSESRPIGIALFPHLGFG